MKHKCIVTHRLFVILREVSGKDGMPLTDYCHRTGGNEIVW